MPGDEGETEDRVSEREELRVLRHDLADLPDRQRSALVLRELNGLSHTEIGSVLDLTPSAVKQSIFEARSALFSCREGREMACHDVRRMLSDGDGRVLRGRGVRAHLRSCSDCRRFKSDLEHRPAALRMLAPPLPTAGAATLLAQLLGGSTAKLVACVAIAGSGTTIAAVEMRDAPKPVPLQAEAASKPRPAPKPKPAVAIVPVVTSAPQETTPTTRSEPAKVKARKSKPTRRGRRPTPPAVVPVAQGRRPEKVAKPEKPEKAVKPRAPKPPKPPKPEKKGKPERLAKMEKPARSEQQTPPGQAKKQAVASEPAATEEAPRNKGQAKKLEDG